MMFWASPKACALAAVVGVALVAAPARGDDIKSCSDQAKCIRWEVTKLTSTTCPNFAPDDCLVQICLVLDDDISGCILKQNEPPSSPDTVDAVCDNANENKCVRSTDWAGSGGGRDPDTGTGNCNSNSVTGPFAWDTVCDDVKDDTKFCQIGKRNQTLYWNLYVGNAWTPVVVPRDVPLLRSFVGTIVGTIRLPVS